MNEGPSRRPLLRGNLGMVSSTHWIASAIGMGVLEQGGNAFDAAVAAGLSLQVLEPHNSSLGGECVALLYEHGTGKTHVVCGQGTIPAGASANRFTALGYDRVPGNGPMAACVPGVLHAWLTIAERFGTMGPEPLFGPSIELAEQGVPTIARMARLIRDVEPAFAVHWPSSIPAYLASGTPKTGQRFRNPQLGATLRRLLAEGENGGGSREARLGRLREAYYQGFVAAAIDRFAASGDGTDVTGNPSPCLVTGEDLAAHRTLIEPPVTVEYAGLLVAKPGPWCQGPVFLQQLAILGALGLDRCDPQDPEYLHTLIEAAKLAYADREAWYGDPSFADIPIGELLSADYAAERARLVGPTASLELIPGSPGGRTPVLPALLDGWLSGGRSALTEPEIAALGEPAIPDGPHARDTCYVAVADARGNVVSAMPSGGWFHSSPAIPGLGFSLGTRAQMTWLEQGLPSSLIPKARPRTTLSPTLLLDSDGAALALGSPGGDRQDQWSLHLLLAWLHSDRDLQEAIEAPNFDTGHFPASFFPRQSRPGEVHAEDRIGERAARELERRGHLVELKRPWSLGRMAAAGFQRDTGWLIAAADPRYQHCYAVGR